MTFEEIRAKYDLPEQYYMISNQFHKHKNHKVVFEAVAALKKKGLHAILAVGQGSKNSSALIISQYAGHKDKKAPYIALVGKGITFDTGGVSLKVPQNMHYMNVTKLQT